MSIRVENITKLYGAQRALDDVTFTINTGDIVGFLGPNGAGKSTMMKIITSYINADHGHVFINGNIIDKDPVNIRKQIGYLPENNPLYLDLYVHEYLEFVAGIYGLRKQRKQLVNDVIEKTGLLPESHKLIGNLSKGYKQRVGLAQALIHDPDVLILDEPTSGLDPNQIVEIRNLISDVGKNKTVMLSTHIMQEVEAICDKIIIINNGKVVADHGTQQIYQATGQKNGFIEVEFNAMPDLKKFAKIKGIIKIRHIEENKYIVETEGMIDIREKIFNETVQQGLVLRTLAKKEQSLESVFQHITKN